MTTIVINNNCEHCWHVKRRPIWMVVPDGCVVMECCKCHTTKTMHQDHLHERSDKTFEHNLRDRLEDALRKVRRL